MAGRNRCLSRDFLRGHDSGRNFRQDRSLDYEGSRAQRNRPYAGRRFGPASRMFGGRHRVAGHDRVYSKLAMARKFGIGTLFPGCGSGGDLGSASRIAAEVLQGFGFSAQVTESGPEFQATTKVATQSWWVDD